MPLRRRYRYLRQGQLAYIPSKTPRERQLYAENSQMSRSPERRRPNEPVATALRSAQPYPRAGNHWKNHDERDQASRPMSPRRYRRIRTNYENTPLPGQEDWIEDDPFYDAGSWWSTEMIRIDRQAKEDKEMERIWRERESEKRKAIILT